MTIKQKELKLRTTDGKLLYVKTWYSNQKPKAVINLVHGIGEHCNRYYEWALRFVEAGMAVFPADLRGHGRTTDIRGHIDHYDLIMNGLDVMLIHSSDKYPKVPVILYGHSMGGNMVINYLLRRNLEIKAAVVTSPWLKLTKTPPFYFQLWAQFGNLFAPKSIIRSKIIPDFISSLSTEVGKIKAYPLIYYFISFRIYIHLIRAAKFTLKQIGTLNIPLLFMHGDADRITSFSGSQQFAQMAGDMCTCSEWEGMYHGIHNNILNELVFSEITDWITSQI